MARITVWGIHPGLYLSPLHLPPSESVFCHQVVLPCEYGQSTDVTCPSWLDRIAAPRIANEQIDVQMRPRPRRQHSTLNQGFHPFL